MFFVCCMLMYVVCCVLSVTCVLTAMCVVCLKFRDDFKYSTFQSFAA